jgi:hypothetical protein
VLDNRERFVKVVEHLAPLFVAFRQTKTDGVILKTLPTTPAINTGSAFRRPGARKWIGSQEFLQSVALPPGVRAQTRCSSPAIKFRTAISNIIAINLSIVAASQSIV